MSEAPRIFYHEDDTAEAAYITLAQFGISVLPADIGFCAVAYWTYQVKKGNHLVTTERLYETRYQALRVALSELLEANPFYVDPKVSQ